MATIDTFVNYAKGKTFDNTGAVNMVSSVRLLLHLLGSVFH